MTNEKELTEALAKALTPFAECCEQIDDDEDDEEWATFRLLVKHYRAFCAALTAQAKPQTDEAASARISVGDKDRENPVERPGIQPDEAMDQVSSAGEYLIDLLHTAVQGKPIRDMDEAIGSFRAAIAAMNGKGE